MRTTTTAAKFCFILLSSLFSPFHVQISVEVPAKHGCLCLEARLASTASLRHTSALQMAVFCTRLLSPLYFFIYLCLFLCLTLYLSAPCLLRGHWQSFIHKNVNQPKCVLLWVSEWVSTLATAMIGGKSKKERKTKLRQLENKRNKVGKQRNGY